MWINNSYFWWIYKKLGPFYKKTPERKAGLIGKVKRIKAGSLTSFGKRDFCVIPCITAPILVQCTCMFAD